MQSKTWAGDLEAFAMYYYVGEILMKDHLCCRTTFLIIFLNCSHHISMQIKKSPTKNNLSFKNSCLLVTVVFKDGFHHIVKDIVLHSFVLCMPGCINV